MFFSYGIFFGTLDYFLLLLSQLSYAKGKKKSIFPIIFDDVDFEKSKSGRGVWYVINALNYIKCIGGVDNYDGALSQLLQGLSKQGQ